MDDTRFFHGTMGFSPMALRGIFSLAATRKLKYFRKLRDLHYVNVTTEHRQGGSHFTKNVSILPKLVYYYLLNQNVSRSFKFKPYTMQGLTVLMVGLLEVGLRLRFFAYEQHNNNHVQVSLDNPHSHH